MSEVGGVGGAGAVGASTGGAAAGAGGSAAVGGVGHSAGSSEKSAGDANYDKSGIHVHSNINVNMSTQDFCALRQSADINSVDSDSLAQHNFKKLMEMIIALKLLEELSNTNGG